jgi:hypothetical protein
MRPVLAMMVPAAGGLRGLGKTRRIGKEPAAAPVATEMPSAAAMLGAMRRPGGIDGHAADGIDGRETFL